MCSVGEPLQNLPAWITMQSNYSVFPSGIPFHHISAVFMHSSLNKQINNKLSAGMFFALYLPIDTSNTLYLSCMFEYRSWFVNLQMFNCFCAFCSDIGRQSKASTYISVSKLIYKEGYREGEPHFRSPFLYRHFDWKIYNKCFHLDCCISSHIMCAFDKK